MKLILILTALAFACSGCITKRTTSGPHGSSEKYVIKRPVKGILDSIEVE